MHVFVDDQNVAEVRSLVDQALPETFRGWPMHYGWDAVPVQSHVVVCALASWLKSHLGFDPRTGMRTVDWLTTPQQLLLEVTGGRVFHDDFVELTAVRDDLAWYPDEVWH